MVSSQILSSTTVIDSNKKNYWALNLFIRMISERWCDTDNWSNGLPIKEYITHKKK